MTGSDLRPTSPPRPPEARSGASGAPRHPVLERLARAVGPALGALSGAVGRVRVRPLHPDGLVLTGRVHRTGAPPDGPASGATWVDTPGADDVVVRLSRGGGLPRPLPDVHGLAFSAPDGDVLLSTPLAAAPGLRDVPFPRLRHGTALYSSLVAYAGDAGPVMLGARPRPGTRRLPADRARLGAELRRAPFVLDLVWATPSSRWRPFGVLAIMAGAGPATDGRVRFDPLRTPPGLRTQPWVRDLRAPAYAAARRRRPGAAGRQHTHRPGRAR